MADEDDSKKSKFNEAVLKMARINKLQDIINICSLNKLALFTSSEANLNIMLTGRRNYSVIFESLNQLLMEVWPKLTEDERKQIDVIRNLFKDIMLRYPIHKVIENIDGKQQLLFQESNWVIQEKYLVYYESIIRTMLDDHGLSSPNERDDEGI